MRWLLSGLFSVLLIGQAFAEDLSLACSGNGTYSQPSTSTATVRNPTTGRSTTATGTTTRTVGISAQVRFEIRGDSARILMPPQMTPPINDGSDNGWWELDRLVVTPETITGRFSVNVFNKPTVHIDRMNGTIEVDGNFRYYFLGQCERTETPTAPRF